MGHKTLLVFFNATCSVIISYCHFDVAFLILISGSTCNRDVSVDVDINDKVADIDNLINQQFSATISSDIYKYLRASEVNISF